MEEATGQDWWQVLAAELKQHIWGYMGLEEIIMASAVCSDWRSILLADQHQPWATIFQRCLGGPPPGKRRAGRMDSWRSHLCAETKGWMKERRGNAVDTLLWCCTHGHASLLRNLIAKDQKGWQQIVYSPYSANMAKGLYLQTVKAGHTEVLSILIENDMISSKKSTSQLGKLLKTASKKGHTQTLALLLDKAPLLASSEIELDAGSMMCGANIFCKCLFAACKFGHEEVAKLLLERHPEKNAAVNMVFRGSQNLAPTALHQACIGGSIAMVRFLLASGAQCLHNHGNIDPPLFLAVKHGHLDLVKVLVEEIGWDINEKGRLGSALRMAAASGRPMILQYLLNRPDCVREGRLKHALQGASAAGKMECVRILLEVDPQMNCYNAADAACTQGHLDIIKLLVEHQPQIIDLAASGTAERGLLQAAIECDKPEKLPVLSYLLDKGLSPNMLHPPDYTCPLGLVLSQEGTCLQNWLSCAVWTLDVVKLLLKAGADVSKLVEFPSKASPSFCALKVFVKGRPAADVFKELVDAGLALSVRDQHTGDTLLHLRAEKPVEDSYSQVLASTDFDVFLCNIIHEWQKKQLDTLTNNEDNNSRSQSLIDSPNFNGATPLMLAVMNANVPLVEALLKCGVDLNRPAFGHPSILHWLISGEYGGVQKGAGKIMKLFLQHGAATDNLFPGTGRTLLHEACNRGITGIIRQFLTIGHMDPNCTIPNPEGGDPITPMMLAIAENDVETVELLIKHGAFVGESEKKAALPGKHSTELRSLLGVPEPAFSSDSDREDEQI